MCKAMAIDIAIDSQNFANILKSASYNHLFDVSFVVCIDILCRYSMQVSANVKQIQVQIIAGDYMPPKTCRYFEGRFFGISPPALSN